MRIYPTIALILSLFLLSRVQSLYSPYYKRCRLVKDALDTDAIPIENLEVQRLPQYFSSFYIQPASRTELPLDYQDFDFYYHQYIDAGGSGEVYLVEDQKSGEGKVVKRYFKEKPKEFARENYIMNKMNQSIAWAKDCGEFKCLPDSPEFNTLAIFPYKQSITLRKLQFDGRQARLIFLKILQELEKSHRVGVIHNDMKLGNIMVNSMGPSFKFYEVQLIDWNLASFYYTGYESDQKRGTVCYYSPQQLFGTYHITPAIDVWALGIVMFTFYTDSKPFSFNCKADNLKAIVSLVGGKKILDLFQKYRYSNVDQMSLLKEIMQNPQKFPEKDFREIAIRANKEHYSDSLIQVFKRMLEPDPELRATPEQLMSTDYFKGIKTLPKMYSMKMAKKGKAAKQSVQGSNQQKQEVSK